VTLPGVCAPAGIALRAHKSSHHIKLELRKRDFKYRVFKKELYNFERVYKFIQRTYTTF
jgi:hypothetical protein